MSDSREGLVLKTYKVPGELYDAAQEACAYRGDPSLSAVIRRALTSYVKSTDRMRENGKGGKR